eukprot:gene14080-15549_t
MGEIGGRYTHGFSKPVEYDDNNAEEDRFVHYLKRRIDRKRAETRLPENGELFEGDMIMDKRLRRNIKDVESKRSALTDTSYKWPNGVIPFELDKSLEFLHNFQKYHFEDVRNLDVPYNYASVMHYRNTAFSRNGEPTLIARNNPGLHFGQREMFSVGDITQINRLYNCYSPTSKLDKQDNFAGKTLLNPIPNVFDTNNGYF